MTAFLSFAVTRLSKVGTRWFGRSLVAQSLVTFDFHTCESKSLPKLGVIPQDFRQFYAVFSQNCFFTAKRKLCRKLLFRNRKLCNIFVRKLRTADSIFVFFVFAITIWFWKFFRFLEQNHHVLEYNFQLFVL